MASALFDGLFVLSIALRMVSSLRMQATSATLHGLIHRMLSALIIPTSGQ